MGSIRFLGPIDVFDDRGGLAAPIQGDPAMKIAVWLALRPNEFYNREVVAEELWPAGTRDTMLNSLGRGLTSLRGTLRRLSLDHHLRVGGPRRSQIGLFDLSSDLATFRAMRDMDSLESAIAVVRGDPLGGLSAGAGMWAETVREALRDELSGVLLDHARTALSIDDYPTGLSSYRQCLQLVPHLEEALRGAAICLAQTGRRPEALILLRERELLGPFAESETIDLKQTLEVEGRPGSTAIGRRTLSPGAPSYERYSPTHTFDGVHGFDNSLNDLLSRDIASSRTYTFRGISGKYVPARLMHRGPGLDPVRLILVDPTASEVIRLRAIDRGENPKYASKSTDQLCADLHNEIVRSLVALFDARAYATISIALVSATAVDRVELTDQSAWLSVYNAALSLRQPFPETMRYSSEAVIYDQVRYDCLRQFGLAQNQLHFRSFDEEGSLLPKLASVGIRVEPSELVELRRTASDFTERFLWVLRGEVSIDAHIVDLAGRGKDTGDNVY